MVQSQNLEKNESPQNNTNIQVDGIEYKTILSKGRFKFSVSPNKLYLHRCQLDSKGNIEEYICFKKIKDSRWLDKEKRKAVEQENKELEKNQSFVVHKILREKELVGYRLIEKKSNQEWCYVLEGYTEKKR